ncbi:MAG: polyprenol phosphomannose-dependent alpha 1,6 mannosyltransferase MptB [Actinomycetota bacterium]|nr:polyprenol phosphomannose-dependent alpha 1,6 mannosyltransferase MptB [Actinomycetota bacterium]
MMPTPRSAAAARRISGYAALDPRSGPRLEPVQPVLLLDRLRPGRLLSGTVLLGLAGSVLVATMAVGAGGILVNDPVITGGPLSWMRYGHGRDLATVALYLGVGMIVWAWVRLGRDVLSGTATVQQVQAASAAWTAPILLSPPLFTRDVYSYLAQGALALRGLDPYLVGPSKLPPGAIADNVHYVWQTTPAPYGPLFILIAKITNWVTGENLILGVIGMRLVLLSGLAVLIFALPRLADQLGGDRTVALWLVITNPVTVVHLVGGPHNDLLMIGLLAAGTLLVLVRRHVAGIALVTMAMAIKASAGIVLPFLVWIWAARLPGSRGARLLRASAGSLAVFGAMFTSITLLSGVGLGWIPALNAPSLIVNWMSLPTAVGQLAHALASSFGDASSGPFIMACRLLGSGVFLAIFAWQWWLARDGEPQAVRRAALALLWSALLAPATLPWYLTWALVLSAALSWPRRSLAWAVAGSTWLVLCTFPTGEDAFTSWPYQLGAVAVSLVAATALLRRDPLGMRGRNPLLPPVPARTA